MSDGDYSSDADNYSEAEEPTPSQPSVQPKPSTTAADAGAPEEVLLARLKRLVNMKQTQRKVCFRRQLR